MHNEDVKNLLEIKAEDRQKFNAELIELRNEVLSTIKPEEYKNSKSKADKLYEHELFDMINGHPLSIILLSSLRKERTLKDIYDQMKKTKEDTHKKLQGKHMMTVALNVEASLQFFDNQSPMLKKALFGLALCPSGLSKADCIHMWGTEWNKCEVLFRARSLIQIHMDFDDSQIQNSNTGNHDELNFAYDSPAPMHLRRQNRSTKKDAWYTIDSSVIDLLNSRMSDTEKEEAHSDVVQRLITILEHALNDSDKQSAILEKYQGNIWKAINMFKDKVVCSPEYAKRNFMKLGKRHTMAKDKFDSSKLAKFKTQRRQTTLIGQIATRRRGTIRTQKKEMVNNCFVKALLNKFSKPADDSKTVANPAVESTKQSQSKLLMNLITKTVVEGIKKSNNFLTDKSTEVSPSRDVASNNVSTFKRNTFRDKSPDSEVDKSSEKSRESNNDSETDEFNSSAGKPSTKSISELRFPVKKTSSKFHHKSTEKEVKFNNISEEDESSSDSEMRANLTPSKSKINERGRDTKITIGGLDLAPKKPVDINVGLLIPDLKKKASVERTLTGNHLKSPAKNDKDKHGLIVNSDKPQFDCSPEERLIILFATNLLKSDQIDMCITLLEETGKEYILEKLPLANIYKLLAVAYMKSEDDYNHTNMHLAQHNCKKALTHFKHCKSKKGMSLCHLLQVYLSLYFEDVDYSD